ncbi:toprim domain-containing protein [Methylomonas paludis]|uniref:Toprim domain-containing protein n=1 Tax=Methylomonas paludis TaxID=1173101 RepID=A0A975ML87_9GAMM|nr:toprim domain-containing protein [Methylomonas paludis]QWF69659.1 toprim domain-containing protein [Methylomonas paludis]
MNLSSIDDACRVACLAIGVEYKAVPSDGRFHVADLVDDHRGRNDGRIKVFPDRQGGIVWNHKSGQKQSFFVNNTIDKSTPVQAAERARIKAEQRRRTAEQLEQLEKASRRAQAIWSAAAPAPVDHPYLARKQVKPYGLRLGCWKRVIKTDDGRHNTLLIEGCLLVPMFCETGTLSSLQAIFPDKHPVLDRDKDFLPSGGLAGLFWWLGAKTDKVLICEGYATGATLHEESGYRVYLAFTANNLMAVGRIVRAKLPAAEIVFCADNDQSAGNPGLTKATEAAADVGGSVAVPPIVGDFNDYALYLREVGHVG